MGADRNRVTMIPGGRARERSRVPPQRELVVLARWRTGSFTSHWHEEPGSVLCRFHLFRDGVYMSVGSWVRCLGRGSFVSRQSVFFLRL